MPPPPPSIPRFASSPYLNRLPSSLLFPFIEDCPEDNGCGGVKSNRLRRRGTERRTSSSIYAHLRHAHNIYSRVRSLLCQSLLTFLGQILTNVRNAGLWSGLTYQLHRTAAMTNVRPTQPTDRPSNFHTLSSVMPSFASDPSQRISLERWIAVKFLST